MRDSLGLNEAMIKVNMVLFLRKMVFKSNQISGMDNGIIKHEKERLTSDMEYLLSRDFWRIDTDRNLLATPY